MPSYGISPSAAVVSAEKEKVPIRKLAGTDRGKRHHPLCGLSGGE
jgi:hypothetical protein